jgi:hypothetical protein
MTAAGETEETEPSDRWTLADALAAFAEAKRESASTAPGAVPASGLAHDESGVIARLCERVKVERAYVIASRAETVTRAMPVRPEGVSA